MHRHIKLVIGLVIIITGSAVLIHARQNIVATKTPTLVQDQPVVTKTVVAQPSATRPTPSPLSGNARRLIIPSVNIDIAVVDGYYNQDSRTWTLTSDKAQFATPTRKPNNESGGTFIYGHNNRKVFSRLPDIKIGAMASIQTDNGHTFTYRYEKVDVVNPSDSGILAYTGPPILTVQTCTGFWYQNRSLFTFVLVEAS